MIGCPYCSDVICCDEKFMCLRMLTQLPHPESLRRFKFSTEWDSEFSTLLTFDISMKFKRKLAIKTLRLTSGLASSVSVADFGNRPCL